MDNFGENNSDRLIIADGVDLCPKHDSCKCEEEDGFKTEEDQQQHGHPRREVTAFCSQEERNKLIIIFFFLKVLNNCVYVAHIPISARFRWGQKKLDAALRWLRGVTTVTCAVVVRENAVVQSAVPLAVYAAGSGSYISECTSDCGVNLCLIVIVTGKLIQS